MAETGSGGGILRIEFAEKDHILEEVNWDDFFAIVDDRNPPSSAKTRATAALTSL